ncbi:hypothetical protein [Novosphingobium sp. HII-3]|uniref:hypothetical protein n=1 Tax=Novosphingobium sp. HII-3 TaxID=2075565 RepID=UPI000CDA7F7C|nr:hypothetical protein [Novosphingobium sp. HII-3]
MAEIRQQIRALVERHLLSFQLRGRPDIVLLAAPLIAHQDDPSLPPPVVPAGLPDAATLAAHLVGHDEFAPGVGDAGLAMPGGVRHPLLQWSPILQIARAASPDGRVAGRTIDALPRDIEGLVGWLEISMGLRPPGWTEPPRTERGTYDLDEVDEANETRVNALDEVRDAFSRRFGFSIADIATWLLAIRAADPVMYVLLLSREYRLALKRSPLLGTQAEGAHAIPGLSLPPIMAIMAIGEVQRVVALYRGLLAARATTADVRLEIGDKARSKAKRGHVMEARIQARRRTGAVYDQAPMRAEALRARLFLIPGRDLSRAEARGVLASLYGGRVDWDNAQSAGTRHGAHELLAATLAPNIHGKRVRGKGLGYHDDDLDLYFGIAGSHIVHLGVTEIGMMFNGAVDAASSITLADRILTVIGGKMLTKEGEHPKDSQAHHRLHKEVMQTLHLYLPLYPARGSAGRTNPLAWLEPERDRRLFKRLLQPIRSGDRRLALRGKAGMVALALWFLQSCFPALYKRVAKRRIALRIACQLATSASVLTSDPLFHSLLINATKLAFPKAPRHRKGTPIMPKLAFPKATKPTVSRETIIAALARAAAR